MTGLPGTSLAVPPLRALTVRQPWAWAILHGGKDVENRSWRTSYRGTLAIHAAAQFDAAGIPAFARTRALAAYSAALERGVVELAAIIGTVELVDCVRDSTSPWAQPDVWHWLLADPRPLERPIRCSGRLGLWLPPETFSASITDSRQPVVEGRAS